MAEAKLNVMNDMDERPAGRQGEERRDNNRNERYNGDLRSIKKENSCKAGYCVVADEGEGETWRKVR